MLTDREVPNIFITFLQKLIDGNLFEYCNLKILSPDPDFLAAVTDTLQL